MKTLKIYYISPDEFKRTEYRPLQREIDDTIETEDEWNYGDVVENQTPEFEGLFANIVTTTSDGLIVWEVKSYTDEDYIRYVVEEVQ